MLQHAYTFIYCFCRRLQDVVNKWNRIECVIVAQGSPTAIVVTTFSNQITNLLQINGFSLPMTAVSISRKYIVAYKILNKTQLEQFSLAIKEYCSPSY